jgi:hypothetical protein
LSFCLFSGITRCERGGVRSGALDLFGDAAARRRTSPRAGALLTTFVRISANVTVSPEKRRIN